MKSLKKWFDINLGWFFINGRKAQVWNNHLEKTYGHGLPSLEAMKAAAIEVLGAEGKMISNSKSGYTRRNPGNMAIFNGCVCAGPYVIWWGDLDITLESEKLKKLAELIGGEVYVLYEYQGRWLKENESPYYYYRSSVANFRPGTFES
jgi:hypothetical protein